MILLPLLLALAALPQDQDAATPQVRRILFDDLFATHGGELRLDLCPERSSRHDGEGPSLLDGDAVRSVPLLEIRCFDDAMLELFGAEGKGITTTFDGRSLVLSSHRPIPAELEPVVAAIGTALRGDERLELRVFSGRLDGERPPLLDAEEADRRERDWIATGVARLDRFDALRLVEGAAVALHDVEEETLVHGWTLEVAGGAELFGPVTDVVAHGLTASVRAARWPGATWLDLALRYAAPTAARRDLTVSPQITLATPVPPGPHDGPSRRAADGSRVQQEPVGLRLELPADRFVSVAASFLVPDGKAVWIPCDVATHAGRAQLLLDVRVHGPLRPPIAALPAGGDGARVRSLLHTSGLASSGFASPPYNETSFVPTSAAQAVRYGAWPSLAEACDVHHDLTETLLAAVAEGERGAARLLPLTADDLLVVAPAAEHDAMVAALRRAFEATGAFEIRGRVLADAETLAEFRLPAAEGRIATLWSGVAGPFLLDWIDAGREENPASKPFVDWFLDGFALSFLVAREDGGPLRIGVSGIVNLLSAPPSEQRRDDPRAPLVEKIDARRLFVAERRDLAADGAATTVKLGGTPFTLELTVTRR